MCLIDKNRKVVIRFGQDDRYFTAQANDDSLIVKDNTGIIFKGIERESSWDLHDEVEDTWTYYSSYNTMVSGLISLMIEKYGPLTGVINLVQADDEAKESMYDY